MSKKAWGVLVGITAFLAMAGTVWAISSYWHSYCSKEALHEMAQDAYDMKQDEDIELAMNQSNLALAQQRMKWLEQRIYELEKHNGCPTNCSGTVERIYQEYVREYEALQQKIRTLMGN